MPCGHFTFVVVFVAGHPDTTRSVCVYIYIYAFCLFVFAGLPDSVRIVLFILQENHAIHNIWRKTHLIVSPFLCF